MILNLIELNRVKNELKKLTHNKQQIMYDSVQNRLDNLLISYEHDIGLISDKLTRRYVNRL